VMCGKVCFRAYGLICEFLTTSAASHWRHFDLSSIAARKTGHGNCMVRREIASRIVVVSGLVCANVSGLFVETSSWP
jgi:hypothetical protein